jgi:hypothetical protein
MLAPMLSNGLFPLLSSPKNHPSSTIWILLYLTTHN